MPNQPTRVLAASLVAALLALFGCSGVVDSLLEDDEELPVKNEAGVKAIGQQFGEAIQTENYAAAYELLSSPRRAEQSLEQFTTTTKQHRLDYIGSETPTKVDVATYMPYRDEFSDWSDFPADLTYDKVLGFAMVAWSFAGPPYGSEVDVLVIDEGGQPKIGHIDWADDF